MSVVIDLVALDQVADEVVLRTLLARIVDRLCEIDPRLGTKILDDEAVIDRLDVDRLQVFRSKSAK